MSDGGYRLIEKGNQPMRDKDMACAECGSKEGRWVTVRVAYVHKSTESVEIYCKTCKRNTKHVSICNGGTRLRPFITPVSLSGRIWSDEEVRCIGANVVDKDDKMHVDPRNGNELRWSADTEEDNILRDKIKHEQAREKGRTPLMFDQSANS